MSRPERDVRAMVLAAGLGTRLRPLTDLLPKPLVTVCGVPLVEWCLELLAKAGIRQVAMNLHHLPDPLRREAAALARERGMALTLFEEPVLLGTGGGLRNAWPALVGSDATVLVNADTLVEVDLGAMIDAHFARDSSATLLIRDNPDPIAYPPVETDPTLRIHRIAGAPGGAPDPTWQPWLFAGVHVLRTELIERLPREPCDVIRSLYHQLIASGHHLYGHPHEGPWWDIGTPGRLLAANIEGLEWWHGPGRRLPPGPDGSRIAADVDVDPSALVRRSVIEANCRVGPGAHIEGSVLMAGAEVGANAVIVDSIVGPDTAVEADAALRRRFAVGTDRLDL